MGILRGHQSANFAKLTAQRIKSCVWFNKSPICLDFWPYFYIFKLPVSPDTRVATQQQPFAAKGPLIIGLTYNVKQLHKAAGR